MNKQDIAIVVALFLLLLGWFFVQQKYMIPPPAPAGMPAPVEQAGTSNAVGAKVEAEVALPKPAPSLVSAPAATDVAALVVPKDKHESAEPEKRVLSNAVACVTISSWGGGIASVELRKYRTRVDPESGPVVLDFDEKPALSFAGVPGLTPDGDFTMSMSEDGRSVRIEKTTDQKLHLERTITLGDGYTLDVVDTFRNDDAVAAALPARGVRLGPMRLMEAKPSSTGISYMGIDTLEDKGGVNVKYWGGKDIPALFGGQSSGMSCARPTVTAMPADVTCSTNLSVAWVAAKSKFFVQILAPDGNGNGCDLFASRNTNASGMLVVNKVSADILFAGKELQPGETWVSKMTYYAGPKEFSSLKPLGGHQENIMEFGWQSGWFDWFRWLCKVLLWTLNALHSVIPNYGVAIILLTLIVRIIFWPVTHKSTESMKKMQAIQPLVNEVRAKFKDKPQKMNEEVMALYKKHKVNPVAGCLPMLVQIPVFIALFVVLRSAVELRFAPFLWIADLSEPEGILAGVLPFGGLNILPLLMTATTVWQQKLTPSSMDPQQQKIMMFMPIVMLFLFYSMASALVLYWTVSQVLAIVQLLWQQKQAAAKAALPKPA